MISISLNLKLVDPVGTIGRQISCEEMWCIAEDITIGHGICTTGHGICTTANDLS